MDETMVMVRAFDEKDARTAAIRSAEEAGTFVVRVGRARAVGGWTLGEDDRQMFEVPVFGDPVPESELRAMDGNR